MTKLMMPLIFACRKPFWRAPRMPRFAHLSARCAVGRQALSLGSVVAMLCAASFSHAVPPDNATAVRPSRPASDVALGRTLQVGPARVIKRIEEAARQARDGDTIEIDAGDYYADVAVWQQDRLTIRGVGGVARLVAAGAHAEGKAIWVVRGGHVTIENIAFSGARVPDHNGAGIRFEQGHLIVRNCVFTDSENGLLTAGGEAQLEIENSEFANNGNGDGHTHNLYVGAIRKLTVKGSYFHHAKVGHLLKSRAAENHIINNRLTDELGGRASYELEFPNGGIAYVIGNIIEQSSTTENGTMISVGGEGYAWPRNELYLISNTIADDRPEKGVFLSVAPGLGALKGVNNLLLGKGSSATGTTATFGAQSATGWREMVSDARALVKNLLRPQPRVPAITQPATTLINTINGEWQQLSLPVRYDYRIRSGSGLAGRYAAPGSANGVDLAPSGQYRHPRGVTPLQGAPTMPGALQDAAPLK